MMVAGCLRARLCDANALPRLQVPFPLDNLPASQVQKPQDWRRQQTDTLDHCRSVLRHAVLRQVQVATNRLTTAELQTIIARWDDGGP
jgi:hypothetical protein